jgi:predicted molibdopterin-dependent oxidoreductase YjgC
MSDITIVVDGVPRRVAAGTTVAVALMQMGVPAVRRATDGSPRWPLCGMGTCLECRATVNGVGAVRTCMEPGREGLSVDTNS